MIDILDGKKLAVEIREDVRREVEEFKNEHGYSPCLAIVRVGNDPASAVYVRNKNRACDEVGITTFDICMSDEVAQADVEEMIMDLNADKRVDGILVQLPLPKKFDEQRIVDRIDPRKDVDCFSKANFGALVQGVGSVAPCTAEGILRLLRAYSVDISGKHVVVVGRSNIVGKPIAQMLLQENATVTICHTKTEELSKHTRDADILIVAVGKPKFVIGAMVKPGAVVIDVGINRTENGKVVGDVDYDSVKTIADYISPVPGGVGPLTVACLLENVLILAERAAEVEELTIV